MKVHDLRTRDVMPTGDCHVESCTRLLKRRNVVVMAGAGVSAGKPAALPAWEPLNAAIVHALTRRLEKAVGRAGWLMQVAATVDRVRNARFPPAFQAEVIEAMCGERYFRALQSLDVDVINASHDAIAALAAGGGVRAIITTNFDRLIEQALHRRGVAHDVAYDHGRFAAASTQSISTDILDFRARVLAH